MTDMLEETTTTSENTPSVSTPPATTSAALPPPPPKTIATEADTNRQRALAIVGAVALLVAVVMGLLWLSSSNSRNDAVAERDTAQAAATAEAQRATVARDALAASEAELEATQAASDQMAADLAAAKADAAEASAAQARAAEAEALVAELNKQNEALNARIAELESELADAQATPPPSDGADVVDAGEASATLDIDASPESAVYIGDLASSRSGSSVLGNGQKSCLGTTLVANVGIEVVGAGLSAGASSSDAAAVDAAIVAAAIECGIDPSAVD